MLGPPLLEDKLLIGPTFPHVNVLISIIACLSVPVHLLWVLGYQLQWWSFLILLLPFFPAAEEETDSTYYGYSNFLLLFPFPFLFEMSSAMPGISLIPLFCFQVKNTNKPSSFCKCQKKVFNEPNILLPGPAEWLFVCARPADHVVITRGFKQSLVSPHTSTTW